MIELASAKKLFVLQAAEFIADYLMAQNLL